MLTSDTSCVCNAVCYTVCQPAADSFPERSFGLTAGTGRDVVLVTLHLLYIVDVLYTDTEFKTCELNDLPLKL